MTVRCVRTATASFALLFLSTSPAYAHFRMHGDVPAERISTRSPSLTVKTAVRTANDAASLHKVIPEPAQDRHDCMQAAIKKRENAIIASLDAFNDRMSRMLFLRKKYALEYWAMDDEEARDTALRAMWKNFGRAWRDEGITMRESRRAAWDAYRIERSACGVYGNDPEDAGLTADSQY